MERTPEEKLRQAPFQVVLGGQEVELRPLTIAKNRIWIGKLAELLGRRVSPDALAALSYEQLIERMLCDLPDQLVDLVALYCELAGSPVTKEWLEEHATQAEVAEAFNRMYKVATPFERGWAELIGLVSWTQNTAS